MQIQKSKNFLYLTSFVTGFVTLSLEMLGFRMFAPYFGNSIFISGSLIGIVLLSLTIGYYLGGILADKKPNIDFMFKLILISSIYIFLMALVYNPILSFFSNFSLMFGTALAAMVIFALPMVLLSTVSPYLVKILSSKNTVGKVTGNISALSTIGNIAGVFITTFIFIPKLGTHKSIYISAIVLLLICIYWLSKKDKRYLFSALLLLTINPAMHITSFTGNVIYSDESEYNLVKVIDKENELSLVLNSDRWMQSMINKNDILSNRYYDFLNLAPLLNDARSSLILGMGSGTSVLQFREFFPEMYIDAVEIDPKVIEVSHRFFNLPRTDANLNIFIEDARAFVKKSNKKYDIIEVDIYNGDIYVPFYLTTHEFFRELKGHLTEDGILVMNVIVMEESRKKNNILNPIANTIASVFPSVFAVKIPYNTILVAANKPKSREVIIKKLKENKIKKLDNVVNIATSVLLEEVKYNKESMLLKDDKSSIEELTYEMYKAAG